MAYQKKLQAEIERTLKKVQEGISEFDEIWEKVYEADSQAHKEKYEADLKKEIKKLQRYRDSIKTWISGSDIKDKTDLVNARKAIEREMERFKVCEKETKTKAFSKEGLVQAAKMDPRDKARQETREWLNTTVDVLNSQIDEFECEIESLSSSVGRKKNAKPPPKVAHLEESITRHKQHVARLEQMLRLLDNDAISAEDVETVKDLVDDYVDRSQDDYEEFATPDDLYEGILEQLENMGEVVGPTALHVGTAPVSKKTDKERERETKEAAKERERERQAALAAKQALATAQGANLRLQVDEDERGAAGGGSKGDGKKPALPSPVGGASSNGGVSAAIPAAAGAGKVGAVAPPPPPPREDAKAVGGGQSTPRSASGQQQQQPPPPAAAAASPVAPAPAPPPGTVQPGRMFANAAAAPPPGMAAAAPGTAAASAASLGRVSPNWSAVAGQDPAAFPQLGGKPGDPQKKGFGAAVAPPGVRPPAPPANAAAAQPLSQVGATPQPAPPPSGPGPIGPSAAVAAAGAVATAGKPAFSQPVASGPPGQQQQPQPPGGFPARAADGKDAAAQQQQVGGPGSMPVAQHAGGDGQASAAAGAGDFGMDGGPLPIGNPAHNLQLLQACASRSIPQPQDSSWTSFPTRVRPPTVPTPSSYPSSKLPILDNPALFSKLDTEALFFSFYYQPGTYQQHLAAKELKNQLWRYHKQHGAWFQRHEEPKATSDTFERGTYVYFDYNIMHDDLQSGWCYRLKQDFTFEYSALEDEI